MRAPGDVLLVSTYELGHAPFALALAAGFLERAGFAPACLDVAVEPLSADGFLRARLVAISTPMHTALRLGAELAAQVRALRGLRPDLRIGFFGLYAALHGAELARDGAAFVLGGECEAELVEVVLAAEQGDDLARFRPDASVAVASPGTFGVRLQRLDFPAPSRAQLPPLERYARLEDPRAGDGVTRVAGYVEASRGCLHHCRHCPIPAVYGGRFFVLPRAVVLDDIARQVAAGATHITFGDPDFLNGPGHALGIARALHERFPAVSFDFTAKVEHLLRHASVFAELRALGCAFVLSAVESLSDTVLERLDKGHTRADVLRLLDLFDAADLCLRPTFVAFTPWTTREDYRDLLRLVAARGLASHVDPVQLSIRLLVPTGSLLLALPDLRATLLPGGAPAGSFALPWAHPDPAMDVLQREVAALVEEAAREAWPATRTHAEIRALAALGSGTWDDLGTSDEWRAWGNGEAFVPVRPPAPRLTEPWFC